ncbi:hypothetical protein Tco_1164540 [Tanacetum coccineum]
MEDENVPIILGRPMLATAHAKIDVYGKKISIGVGNDQVVFNINKKESPVFISPICVINEVDKTQELVMNDEKVRDFENYLSPEYGSQDIISLSPSELVEDKKEFSMTLCDLDKRMSIGLEEFVDIDDMWDDLDTGILSNEKATIEFLKSGEIQESDKIQGKKDLKCSIFINTGLIQAILTSLPPQPIGEAKKASNLRRIPPRVQGRSHFTYFLYSMLPCKPGFGSMGGTMAGVGIDTLTMEQYLALSQENQAPDMFKPEIRAAKRWVDRLALGTINTWDLLKKAFIQRYCPPSMTAKQLEDIITSSKKETNHYTRPRSGPRPTEALTSIQSMADHSQKWHDGITSRNIRSSSSKDGIAALVNKLDNLGRDMKKLKESVHAIQVGCQICEGPHLDKDCPLNKEAKQVEEPRLVNRPHMAKKADLRRIISLNIKMNLQRRSNEMEAWIKKLHENAEINTRNQSASLKNLETQIEQLTKEIRSDKTLDSSSEQIKTITADQETSGLNKLHGVSFTSDPESDATEVLQHQLPRKELNPGNFTPPCTISKFNFYAMTDLDMSKKAPLGIVENVLVKIEIDVFAIKISLGINEDRISFDLMRNSHKYTNPSERISIVRPQSPAQSNNQIDYKESGNWDNRSPNLDDREPKKHKLELDKNVPRAHFCSLIKQNIKEQTNMWSSCDPDKKICDGRVEICGVSKTGNFRFWYYNYDNERRNIKGKGLSFPDFLLAKYGKIQIDTLVWDSRYVEWCDISPSSEASSQEPTKPRPKDYTFREWTLIKVGHTDIIEPVKKALLKIRLINCFQDNSACENNLTHKSFDDYKWEFNLEIDKLVDEYKLGIGKKGHNLDHIWEYCNQVHNKNYEWHNYEFKNEECEEIRIEEKDYHPPEVHVETFEVKKYSFKGGQVHLVYQRLG